jgi:hypothetical protein
VQAVEGKEPDRSGHAIKTRHDAKGGCGAPKVKQNKREFKNPTICVENRCMALEHAIRLIWGRRRRRITSNNAARLETYAEVPRRTERRLHQEGASVSDNRV